MGEPITNLPDAVRVLGALPVSQGPESQALSMDPRIELIRRERTHCEAAQFESEDDRLPHVWGPSQYPGMEMCQRCTVRRDWAEDAEAADTVLLAEVDRLRAQVAALLAERHTANESLDDAAKALRVQRDRIAELEAEPRLGSVVAWLRHWSDVYYATPGRSESGAAVMALAERAERGEIGAVRSADRLTRMLAPSQVLREDAAAETGGA